MAYSNDSIANIIKHKINTLIYLPAIQREFEWEEEKIVKLFDSMLRGFPIGTFLFWDVQESTVDNLELEIYKFISNYKKDESYNDVENSKSTSVLTLVLDGQQRLTSLLIGLKGFYAVQSRGKNVSWIERHLHLDLFWDGTRKGAEDEDLSYGFEFRTKGDSGRNQDSYWFEVAEILRLDSIERFNSWLDDFEQNELKDSDNHQIRLASRILTALYKSVWELQLISYYNYTDQDYAKVTEIFVRTNSGGKTLEKSDLLLSTMTAEWAKLHFNAREEVHTFVKKLNKELTVENNLRKDFVLKSILVLSDLDIGYKIENFTSKNLAIIKQNWIEMMQALERTVRLTNELGIDRATLTSANTIIPIAYYFFKQPSTQTIMTTEVGKENQVRIWRWLLTSLLNKSFSGQSDTALKLIRDAIKGSITEPDGFFPEQQAYASLRIRRKVDFDDDLIGSILDVSYTKRECFLVLSLMRAQQNWGNLKYHKDHIFPQSFFLTKYDAFKNLPEHAQREYKNLENKVCNLQLLQDGENLNKLGKDPGVWFDGLSTVQKEDLLLPLDRELYRYENFLRFTEEREKLITNRLKNLLPNSVEVKVENAKTN